MTLRAFSVCLGGRVRSALAALIVLAGLGGPALSHPHHGEAIDETEALAIAREVISDMVAIKVVGSSWTGATRVKTERQVRFGAPEWVLTFLNQGESDPTMGLLVISIGETGEVLDVIHAAR